MVSLISILKIALLHFLPARVGKSIRIVNNKVVDNNIDSRNIKKLSKIKNLKNSEQDNGFLTFKAKLAFT